MSSHQITWLAPDDPPAAFPDVETALRDPDGLLPAGGDLSTERLLAAYAAGIFPWFEEGQPILWWSPDPRCVIRPADFHIARRLAREIRTSTLALRFDSAFAAVVDACAAPRRTDQGTWITRGMASAYVRLYDEGWAHSVEIWNGDRLVGGMYGLCIGRVFFGESMFSGESNTSKMAILGLTRHMQANDIELLDCQVVSPHLLSLGATTLPRPEFTRRIREACGSMHPCGNWPGNARQVGDLL